MNRLLGTIAATLLFATPALAQQSVYDTNPTPQERAQTDRLNSDAAAAARAPSPAEKDAPPRNYDRARVDDRAGDVRRWDVFYGYRGFRDVDRMRGGELMGRRVNARGGFIGRVRNVESSPHGRIVRIAIDTGDGQTAWITADDLRFDPVNLVVMTDLSRSEIDDRTHVRF